MRVGDEKRGRVALLFRLVWLSLLLQSLFPPLGVSCSVVVGSESFWMREVRREEGWRREEGMRGIPLLLGLVDFAAPAAVSLHGVS